MNVQQKHEVVHTLLKQTFCKLNLRFLVFASCEVKYIHMFEDSKILPRHEPKPTFQDISLEGIYKFLILKRNTFKVLRVIYENQPSTFRWRYQSVPIKIWNSTKVFTFTKLLVS